MANNVRSLENINWHMTKAEAEARAAAEKDFLPERPATLKMPKSMTGDKTAQRYWKTVLSRMDGLAILDELDTEILAIYVSALSRRDELQAQYRDMMALVVTESDTATRLAMIKKLDSLLGRVQAHEKTLLSYANALGLTPEARIRLARKQAAKAAEPDPDADLFGD